MYGYKYHNGYRVVYRVAEDTNTVATESIVKK